MSLQSFDIAVIGGGLAGSSLTLFLLQKGKKVLLIDDAFLSQSSRIAAGIYNPVVFKRTTLAWRASELHETSRQFYARAEAFTQNQFHHELPFYRFFSGFEEQNEWMARSGQDLYQPFLSGELLQAQPPFASPFGMSMVKGAGWLNTVGYIQAVREKLLSMQGHWEKQRFDPGRLQTASNGFVYDTYAFDKVVFCEGHLVRNNPWFGFVRLFPVKGEVLELEVPALPVGRVYNGSAYMLVMPNGRVKLGSTYDWENLNDEATPAGRTELLEKFESFYKGEKTVIGQGAGVRPAGHDRRPILGEHPTEKNMYLLNGLGAKGVSLGPWCVKELYSCMYEGKIPDKEVSVQRYIK